MEKQVLRGPGPKWVHVAPSLTTSTHLPPGFSTLAQLKRRNTLKDGIIMIQTLLIILFIIVPIFLLLDKVTVGAGQAPAGSPSPQPQSPPTDSPIQTLPHSSAVLAECPSTLTLHPSPFTQDQSPWPSPAWPSSGWGKLTLLSIPPLPG